MAGLEAAYSREGSDVGALAEDRKVVAPPYELSRRVIGQTAPADPLNHPETTLVNFWPAIQKYGIQKYGQAPAWANGIIPIEDSGDTTPDGQVYIAIVDPVPFNLVGITTRFALSEI
jgi:hypothetical protein